MDRHLPGRDNHIATDMKRNCFSIYAILSCLSLAASCEREQDSGQSENQSVGIRLEVMEAATGKALPQISEAAVRDLNIFLFDEDGILAESFYTRDPDREIYINTDTDRIGSVYAVANIGDITGSNGAGSLEELLQMKWKMESPEDISGEDGEIPMSGMIRTGSVSDGETLTVPLSRMLSKFRIIADTAGLDDDISVFEITGIDIRNMNRAVGLFHDSRAESPDMTFGTGITAEGQDLENLFTTGVDFYVPENMQGDLLQGNADETAHIPPEPFGEICTYVELHVKYRSSTSYNDNMIYRYYLHDGRDLDNFDLVRNTMYTCRTSFKGSGINENSWRIDLSGMKDLVTSVSVNPDSVTFFGKGETCMLAASVLPASAENPEVIWSSDNGKVASVSEKGKVTAISEGQCSIIASAADGSGVSDSARISVYIESRRFDMQEIPDTLFPGYNSPFTIEYTTFPATVPEFHLDVADGHAGGAFVDGTTLYAVNPDGIHGTVGNYVLTGKANGLTCRHEFTVDAGEVRIRRVENALNAGIAVRLETETLRPSGISTEWSSSDPDIAMAGKDGTVYPQREGTCHIRAVTASGAHDSIKISVNGSYLSFADVTLYEGAVWELSSGLRPVPSDINVQYSVIEGKEHVSVNGHLLRGLKRTDGFSDVVIEARLTDYPHIFARARVHVLPAVTATLEGDNRLVNTRGYPAGGNSWQGFRTSMKLESSHAPNIPQIFWIVTDAEGKITSDVTISENGTVTPASKTVNGTFLISGWDEHLRYSTDTIKIEIYRLLEYEVGLRSYETEYLDGTYNGRRIYTVNLEARFSAATWNILSAYEQNMVMQQNVITYPRSSGRIVNIGAYGDPELYAVNCKTDIVQNGSNIFDDMEQFKPYSYLIGSFSNIKLRVPGTEGVYYKFNPLQNRGFSGYYFYYQKSADFYNR